jgi:two-component system sensor histidine kinase/response regulator
LKKTRLPSIGQKSQVPQGFHLQASNSKFYNIPMGKHRILCIDDEVDNVDALERLFRKKYTVIKATSGQEALKWLKTNQEPLALIITDQRMPEMTGVELLERTLTSHPETVRILLTGYTDLESVIAAVNQGQIYRYLTKPWDPIDLGLTVDRAVERYVISQELKQKNKELAKALEELQTLDQAKSHFMILINHELKTPLTSILNFGALLSETSLDTDQEKYLLRIQQSTARLKALVDDVLLIMKAETQQLIIEKNSLNLKKIIDPILMQLQGALENKAQTIAVSSAIEQVTTSDLVLGQVLIRLLQNANRFGTAKQAITFDVLKLPSQKIRFQITNQGPSISEKVTEKIFKPFYLDENVMNHTTGTGLGLTVCQSLLKLVESGINIKNTADGVSVFFDI